MNLVVGEIGSLVLNVKPFGCHEAVDQCIYYTLECYQAITLVNHVTF